METKTVTFLGNVYDVPVWTNYMTHDMDGVYAWELQPMLSSNGEEYVRAYNPYGGYRQCITNNRGLVVCESV